jgi:hypothetical protein
MKDLLIAYPNIDHWLGRPIRRLRRFPEDEYVVLRDELAQAETEEQYRRDLGLLDDHLALAASRCSRFDRLIKERSSLGTDIEQANRMLLDKLAEVRAIVGLHRLGFRDIAYQGTPDLSATLGASTFAVEVTRLAASADQTVPLLTVIWPGDGSEDKLAEELFAKIQAKQGQLSKSPSTYGNHVIWISLGRDYFTAGRYERVATGLRRKMPGHVRGALELAAARARGELRYRELAYVVVCPGRKENDIIVELTSP